MTMKSLFMVCAIVLLVSFSVMQTNHASRLANEVDAIPDRQCIQINQGAAGTLPSGIPLYLVEIFNRCPRSCHGIHFSCGEFASARLVNPRIFRRLKVNDCLVNNGALLKGGYVLSFSYANTFSYPLAVASLTCLDMV